MGEIAAGLSGWLMVGLLFLMAGCAGPSRARYAQLLRECRAASQEHQRLYRACEERLVVNGIPVPEQTRGAAEMGLGGF